MTSVILKKKINEFIISIISNWYLLYRFLWVRKKIGGAWVKTKYKGWIKYEIFLFYKGYQFDPIVLISEEEGIVKWTL